MGLDGWDIDFSVLWAEIVNYYNLVANISITFTASDGEIVTIPYLWVFGGVLLVDAIIDLILGFRVSKDEAFDDVD